MAYIVDAEARSIATGFTSTTLNLPTAAVAGDLVVFIFNVSVSSAATFTLSAGWTTSPNFSSNNNRCVFIAYKVIAGGDGAVTFTPSISVLMDYQAVTIRHADSSNPIEVVAKNDHSATSTDPVTATGLTTLTDNALVVYAFGLSGAGPSIFPTGLGDVTAVTAPSSLAPLIASGYRVVAAAGASGNVSFARSVGNGYGQSVVFSVRNASGGGAPPTLLADTAVLNTYWTTENVPSISAASASGISSILGRPVSSLAPTITRSALLTLGDTDAQWSGASQFNSNQISGVDATGIIVGAHHALPSPVNLSGAVLSLLFYDSGVNATLGSLGYMLLLQDTSDNWAAFQIVTKTARRQGAVNKVFIHADQSRAIASSGTLDWTAINRVGIVANKATTTITGLFWYWRNLLAHKGLRAVGGSAANQVSASWLAQAISAWVPERPAVKQATSQLMLKVPVSLGDGSTQTYVDLRGGSIETPIPYNDAIEGRNWWNVGGGALALVVNASATDTMLIRSVSFSSSNFQVFRLAATSSPSANYDFSGLVLTGVAPEFLAGGVTVNDATILRCKQVILTSKLLRCSVIESVDSSAVVVSDLELVEGCGFTSSGTGHAIEITQPGSYTFSGNTFQGYGASGTTDAAIYNNSGGAVTINLSGGGDTPTVRNGTGASTTVNNSVTLTLENIVVGSSIRIELVSDGSLVEFRTASSTTEAFAIAGGANYRVKVRKATSAPYYRAFETQTGTITDNATVYVSQISDE